MKAMEKLAEEGNEERKRFKQIDIEYENVKN